MEEQEDAPVGIEEEEQKENQPEMVSENPIDEEREDLQNSPEEDNNLLDREDAPGEMEEEEKVNQEQAEQFSVENEAEGNEAISEEVEGRENEQPDQNQEPSPNHPNSLQQLPDNQDQEAEEVEMSGKLAAEPAEQEAEPQPAVPSQAAQQIDQVEALPHPQINQQAQQKEPEVQQEEGEAPKSPPKGQQDLQSINQKERQLAQEQARFEAQRNAAEQAAVEQKRAQENFAYTNKLQRLVERLSESLAKSKNEQEGLRNSNRALATELSTSKQMLLDLRKKKMELDMDKLKLTKETDRLKRQNTDFKERLSEIEKIGNVLVLQSTIEELRVLTTAQQQEISQLKQASTQQAHNYYQQQFNLLETYQNELNSLRDQNESLKAQLEHANNQNQELIQAKQQIQSQNSLLKQSINTHQADNTALKGEVETWKKKWQSFEDERAEFKRTRELDQKVSQYESERFMGEENDVQIIPILSDKEEKNLLLKEYLKLEALYEECKNKQELAETRLKRVLRDTKIQQANVIRKKDYHDLLSRYRKAKTCLEGAFAKLKALESVQASPKAIREEVHELLQGNESRLCQTIIKRTNEQSQMVAEKIAEMELTDELITLKKDNARLRDNQVGLEREIKINEKIISLLNAQLEAKKKVVQEQGKVIERLIQAGCHHQNEYYQQRIAQLQQYASSQKETLAALQVKTILLIRENESHLHQINHWRSLYDNIKAQLSQKITHSLLSAASPSIPAESPVESSQFCRQCQRRNLQAGLSASLEQQGVQTESNYDLHYKEIKESLICLKRINKEVQGIPESHKRTIQLITDFRDKYEKYIEKYNAKLLELRREKADNENWRIRTREEIRAEFQDIRDIISNNRLTTALRQAKSLIEYLQNEQEKGQEEGQEQEEGEEAAREEPVA